MCMKFINLNLTARNSLMKAFYYFIVLAASRHIAFMSLLIAFIAIKILDNVEGHLTILMVFVKMAERAGTCRI